jgi:protein disulfide-isomerase-like protein
MYNIYMTAFAKATKKASKFVSSGMAKLQKKLKFLTKPKNGQKVLLLLAILFILFLAHKYILSKEGFASTPENLEDDVAPQKSMVLFHADWCGHCKKFMPTWDSLSSKWNDSQKNVKLMKVDCGKPAENEAHAELMKKYNIKGYPTILVFENGNFTEYEGARSEADIETFLKLA